MKKIIKLNESELTDIVKRVISESELDRRIISKRVTQNDLNTYDELGLTLYYFDSTEGVNFGLHEYKIPKNDWSVKESYVLYALTSVEYNKMKLLIDNVGELIKGLNEEIRLRKLQIRAVLDNIVSM